MNEYDAIRAAFAHNRKDAGAAQRKALINMEVED